MNIAGLKTMPLYHPRETHTMETAVNIVKIPNNSGIATSKLFRKLDKVYDHYRTPVCCQGKI